LGAGAPGYEEIAVLEELGIWSNEKSRRDKSGQRWNFCYWYAGTFADKSRRAARLFYWDDNKEVCGVVLILPGAVKHYSRISELIDKLVAHQSVRKQYQRDLTFPLEKHYTEYGIFPEENQTKTQITQG
jgi:hypothetical protein